MLSFALRVEKVLSNILVKVLVTWQALCYLRIFKLSRVIFNLREDRKNLRIRESVVNKRLHA